MRRDIGPWMRVVSSDRGSAVSGFFILALWVVVILFVLAMYKII